MVIRVAIVEDERECSARMMEHLNRYQEENGGVRFLIDVFENAVDFLSDYKSDTDVVFMDIEMPLMNGLDAARKLREKQPDVVLIFVTRMARYAVKGYEVDAMDFMIKPINYCNFSLKLKKAIRIADRNRHSSVYIKTEVGLKRFFVSDILYIEVIKHYTYIHARDGVYKQQIPLKELEEQLSEAGIFTRCNNCYLVNLSCVSRLEKNEVWIEDDCLQISKPRRKEFINALTNYLNGGILL